MKNNKIKIILGILIIFFTGTIIGAMGNQLYVKHKFEKFVKHGGPPPELLPKLIKKLSRQLNLTSSQRSEIEDIAKQLRKAIFEFQKKYHPEMEKIVEQHILLVKEKLTPQQQKKMDQIHEKLKKRWLRPRKFGRHNRLERFLEHLKKELNLSENKVNQIRPILKEHFRKHNDLLKKETAKSLENILTPEQMQDFHKLQKKRFHKKSEMEKNLLK